MTLSYQSAAIVFLDGGWVSKGLVMVSLAFHLSLAQLFLLLCSYVKSKTSLFLERKMWVPHIKNKDSVHM